MERRTWVRFFRKFTRLVRGKANVTSSRYAPLSTLPVLYESFDTDLLQDSIDYLQTLLQKKGFLESKTGEFDAETKLAVEEFQKASELKVDGVVGQLTWAALLCPVLCRSNAISEELTTHIRSLQICLHQERLKVKVDGVFGKHTERALKRFQRRYGLQADGICGPITWSLLLGQRPEWDGKDKANLSFVFVAEQILIVMSIFAGIYFSPLGEKIEASFFEILAIAYSLSCLGQPLIDQLMGERLASYDFPLMRYAPYVIVGFLWRHLLHRVVLIFS